MKVEGLLPQINEDLLVAGLHQVLAEVFFDTASILHELLVFFFYAVVFFSDRPDEGTVNLFFVEIHVEEVGIKAKVVEPFLPV